MSTSVLPEVTKDEEPVQKPYQFLTSPLILEFATVVRCETLPAAGLPEATVPLDVFAPVSLAQSWQFPSRESRERHDHRPRGTGRTEQAPRRTGPILIVEDDIAILSTVSDILEFEGYSAVGCTNGADALAVVAKEWPSLVLLDMRMPVLDGWAFATELRARGFNIPILVMTAARDAQRWAEEINADGYIAKPFQLTELLGEVERLLGGGPGPSHKQ